MMKDKVFVFGDVHGEIKMMKKLLEYWNEKEEQLVILGDLADRGPNSRETFELAYELMRNKNAIIVKGNHDDMLEKYLQDPIVHHVHYYMNGGKKTLLSLLGNRISEHDHEENALKVKQMYPWLLDFLKSLSYFYEWEDYLFVHAGVNLTLDNWRESSKRDFIWIREGFYDQQNTTDKTIVFGHTVTSSLHGDMSNFGIWESGDGLIGIDGGAVYGGKLHGLRLSRTGIEKHYSIRSKN